MQANTNQWYARWFLWSCRVLDRWRMDDGNREQRALIRGTDLCRFFRTLLWSTLISTWSIGLWAYLAFTVLVLPFMLFNITTVAMPVAMGIIITIAALAVTAAMSIALALVRWTSSKVTAMAQKDTTHPPGFARVCWRYVVGIKRRFCPTITFKENDHA